MKEVIREDRFYNKVFKGTLTTLTRRELECLPIPFYTADASDETMQEIIDNVDKEMKDTYGSDFDLENDSHYEYWFEVMEREVYCHEIPYYEDLDFDE